MTNRSNAKGFPPPTVPTEDPHAATTDVDLGQGPGVGSDPATQTEAATTPRRYRWLEAAALPVLFAVTILVFGAVEPQTFLSVGNAASVLGTNTVLLLVTAAVLLPLILSEFDLSLGSIAGLSGMVLAILNVQGHMPVLPAALIAVAVAGGVGAINAALIVRFDNNSFIVTLATGTAVTGIVYGISGSQTVSGTSPALSAWVFSNTFLGIPLEFYYGIALMLVGWYVIEMTPLGQRMTFIGQSHSVANLSGIRVSRVRVYTFIAAGLVAGLAGVVAVGTAGSADPTTGPGLVLPAFAAAFLGSTAVRPGRPNMLGAIIAVYFLAVGIDGLQLLGVQNYVHGIFYGVALIVAVTASQLLKKRYR